MSPVNVSFLLTKEKMGVSETVGISLLCYLLPWCGMIKFLISRLLGNRQPICRYWHIRPRYSLDLCVS